MISDKLVNILQAFEKAFPPSQSNYHHCLLLVPSNDNQAEMKIGLKISLPDHKSRTFILYDNDFTRPPIQLVNEAKSFLQAETFNNPCTHGKSV